MAGLQHLDEGGSSAVRYLWSLGDPWRNLRPEIMDSLEPVVVTTVHRTVRVLNAQEGWQMRLPPVAGARIIGDGLQLVLAKIEVATPCGIVTWGDSVDSWSASTAILTVHVADPEGAQDGTGPPPIRVPSLEDHPPTHCGARYCQLPAFKRQSTGPGQGTTGRDHG